MAGRFWVGGKMAGGILAGENVRGDFGREISTISRFSDLISTNEIFVLSNQKANV